MNSIHLHGAEDVRSAGHTMARAADTMQSAASSISGTMERHQYQMDSFVRSMTDLVERFEHAVQALNEPRPVYTVPNPNEPKAYGGA